MLALDILIACFSDKPSPPKSMDQEQGSFSKEF